ncbi:ferredoxin [Actinoplanes sp. NPDC049265]|uniref:ferredoxin n=1 Tax=Actinoplanes sp. NPDC049265 TaxID=3363902 RepID=UPI0037163A98
MRIEADEAKCVAAGQCVVVAPDVFDQRNDDGIVVVLEEMPDPRQHDAVREAAAICPAAAIRLVGE